MLRSLNKTIAQPVQPTSAFPYHQTFDAICAATRIESGSLAVSVRAFKESWNATGGKPAQPVQPTALGSLAERRIFDAIRSAYDMGYADARNIRTVPGDSAPGYKGREIEADHGGALLRSLNKTIAQPVRAAPLNDLGVSVEFPPTWWKGWNAAIEAQLAIESDLAGITQPEQEPVAGPAERPFGYWDRKEKRFSCDENSTTFHWFLTWEDPIKWPDGVTLLYTSPPQRQPLTQDRIQEIWVEHGLDECDVEGFARALEAAHDIKAAA